MKKQDKIIELLSIISDKIKQKPLELDLFHIERIAERHGVTPKLALDIFNDIHDVATVLNNDDQFLPPYSNKKVVDLGDFTTIHIGQVATNDTNGGRSHELRIRVFQKDTPMSEHTVSLPMPSIKLSSDEKNLGLKVPPIKNELFTVEPLVT